jgi:hypothetical protein
MFGPKTAEAMPINGFSGKSIQTLVCGAVTVDDSLMLIGEGKEMELLVRDEGRWQPSDLKTKYPIRYLYGALPNNTPVVIDQRYNLYILRLGQQQRGKAGAWTVVSFQYINQYLRVSELEQIGSITFFSGDEERSGLYAKWHCDGVPYYLQITPSVKVLAEADPIRVLLDGQERRQLGIEASEKDRPLFRCREGKLDMHLGNISQLAGSHPRWLSCALFACCRAALEEFPGLRTIAQHISQQPLTLTDLGGWETIVFPETLQSHVDMAGGVFKVFMSTLALDDPRCECFSLVLVLANGSLLTYGHLADGHQWLYMPTQVIYSAEVVQRSHVVFTSDLSFLSYYLIDGECFMAGSEQDFHHASSESTPALSNWVNIANQRSFSEPLQVDGSMVVPDAGDEGNTEDGAVIAVHIER